MFGELLQRPPVELLQRAVDRRSHHTLHILAGSLLKPEGVTIKPRHLRITHPHTHLSPLGDSLHFQLWHLTLTMIRQSSSQFCHVRNRRKRIIKSTNHEAKTTRPKGQLTHNRPTNHTTPPQITTLEGLERYIKFECR